jgi:hypothetical protein
VIVRLLLILLAGFIVWKLVRVVMAKLQGPDAAKTPPEFEKMITCRRCGVHLPPALADEDGRCQRCRS